MVGSAPWGKAVGTRRAGSCLYEGHIYILNEICAKDKVYIFVGTLLG
jgi:hypothetical protein